MENQNEESEKYKGSEKYEESEKSTKKHTNVKFSILMTHKFFSYD